MFAHVFGVCVCVSLCVLSLYISFWWLIAVAQSQILAGHWLTVAQGDNLAGCDWSMILIWSDSLVSAT